MFSFNPQSDTRPFWAGESQEPTCIKCDNIVANVDENDFCTDCALAWEEEGREQGWFDTPESHVPAVTSRWPTLGELALTAIVVAMLFFIGIHEARKGDAKVRQMTVGGRR